MDLEILQTFFAVVEEGSLNKAAERLRLSQSTLTRRVQALEHEVGGQLLERTSSGVAPTAAGQRLYDGAGPVLDQFESVLEGVRRFARGQRETLRLGYVASAAGNFLNGALARLRENHPEIRLQLLDLSPGEQLASLRTGAIDAGLVVLAGVHPHREFYARRLAAIPVTVALPTNSPLVGRPRLGIADLRDESFIGAPDDDMPGFNQWLVQLGRGAGFRPRVLSNAESLAHGLATVVTDGATMLLPAYVAETPAPGITFRVLDGRDAQWELAVLWQRGKIAPSIKTLVDALADNAREICDTKRADSSAP